MSAENISPAASGTRPSGSKRKPFVIGQIPGFGAFSWLFFAYLYVPILILVIFSFNESRSATVWSAFSLDWYLKAFSNDDIQRAGPRA